MKIRLIRLAALSMTAVLLVGDPLADAQTAPEQEVLQGLTLVTPEVSAPSDRSLARVPPEDVIALKPGNAVSFCPTLECNARTRDGDHQRASALFSSVSRADGEAQEQTIAVHTLIRTGFLKKWLPNTPYEIGDNVQFTQGDGNATYRAVQAGVSARRGRGPRGKGDAIADGGVVWKWINVGRQTAKVGLYNEVINEPGAGKSWAQANNFELAPGVQPTFHVNTEFDFTNRSGVDCLPGKAGCHNLFLVMQGKNRATSVITATAPNTDTYASVWGIRLAGDYLASQADIELDGGAKVALGIHASGIGGGRHEVAGIHDASQSPRSLWITGPHSIASIQDSGTSTNGILLDGTYEKNQILGQGFSVDAGGVVLGQAFKAKPYKVAELPPCDQRKIDQLVVVSDARAPEYRGRLVGGGRERTLAYCDGQQWSAH